MIIKFDTNSYKSSHIFNYITEDLMLVNKSFEDNLLIELESIESNDKEFEKKRLALFGEYIDADLTDIYIEELKNTHLRNFMFNGALLYYYSQLEIKLLEICKRLPMLLGCPKIGIVRSNKFDKISKYLSKQSGIYIEQSKYWRKISDFKEIRNYLNHTEEVSEVEIPKYKSIASRNKGKVSFHQLSNTISIEISYLSEIIEISYNFIEQIIIDIWEKHKISK